MPVGLSDHSRGCTVAVVATSMGARVIEKHFTLDRNEDSIDGEFSMLPHEFAQMVEQVKIAHAAIGSVGYYQNEISAPGAFLRDQFWFLDLCKRMNFSPRKIFELLDLEMDFVQVCGLKF